MTGTSKEYAVALLSLAEETDSQDEILNALSFVREVFEKTPELFTFLASPGISKSTRVALMEQTFSGEVPEYVASFLALLCEHGDTGILFECIREYETLYSIRRRVAHAAVTSVVPLTDEEKARLLARLERMSGCRVEAEYRLDEALLGGVIVEMDGTILDGSLRRRLQNIKEVIN